MKRDSRQDLFGSCVFPRTVIESSNYLHTILIFRRIANTTVTEMSGREKDQRIRKYYFHEKN